MYVFLFFVDRVCVLFRLCGSYGLQMIRPGSQVHSFRITSTGIIDSTSLIGLGFVSWDDILRLESQSFLGSTHYGLDLLDARTRLSQFRAIAWLLAWGNGYYSGLDFVLNFQMLSGVEAQVVFDLVHFFWRHPECRGWLDDPSGPSPPGLTLPRNPTAYSTSVEGT